MRKKILLAATAAAGLAVAYGLVEADKVSLWLALAAAVLGAAPAGVALGKRARKPSDGN